MRLSELQAAFRAYLLGEEPMPALTGQIRSDGIPVARRLAVYRNNVTHALIEALAAAYPVVQRLVGDAFFQAVAREYARCHPPTRGTLIGYGESFAGYLETLSSTARLPYLGDVARLEYAWLTAYHAPDATPLEANDLAGLPQAVLPELHLRLHPSAQLLETRYPVREIWTMNRRPGAVPPLRLANGPGYCLVIRPHLDVRVEPLSAGSHTFLKALGDNATLTGAFQQALAVEPELDLQTQLHQYFIGGILSGWNEPSAPGAQHP